MDHWNGTNTESFYPVLGSCTSVVTSRQTGRKAALLSLHWEGGDSGQRAGLNKRYNPSQEVGKSRSSNQSDAPVHNGTKYLTKGLVTPVRHLSKDVVMCQSPTRTIGGGTDSRVYILCLVLFSFISHALINMSSKIKEKSESTCR